MCTRLLRYEFTLVHIGLEQENNGVLPNYTRTVAFLGIGNTVSKYIEA